MNYPAKRKRNRVRPSFSAGTDLSPVRCIRCRRPQSVCHCDLIPKINNATEIVIAQDISERSHPFNTARMANQALVNSRLLTDYPENIRRHSEQILPTAGLLYPSKTAIDITDIAPNDWPKQLVLLDGTWNQVKRLYRNWPELHGLQHFKIQPKKPGNYRIRLEPNDFALSTVEAVVAALEFLEPDLKGLQQLTLAFETMVDRQLAHPAADYTNANKAKKPTLNIPSLISNPDTELVVAYGEAEPVQKGSPKKIRRTPVYWIAKRLSDGSTFQTTIQSNQTISAEMLTYFQLPATEFSDAIPVPEFQQRWEAFLRPHDILVVYNHGTLRLLNEAGIRTPNTLALRSVNFNPGFQHETLTEFFARHKIRRLPVEFPGRAGQRLANLTTLIEHLRQMKTPDGVSH